MHRTIDGIVLDLDTHRRSKTHKSKQVREVVHDSSRSRNSSIQGTAPTGHMQGKPRLRLQRPSIIHLSANSGQGDAELDIAILYGLPFWN